jgi:hypothetical protein
MYQFAGFFAKPALERPDELPPNTVWREISSPFVGVGVRLPDLIGKAPRQSEIFRLLKAVGLGRAASWLYINYTCWGGRIDSIYGLGMHGRRFFGPVKETDLSIVRDDYVDLMSEFGVQEADALNFPPFKRGFWGEG